MPMGNPKYKGLSPSWYTE